MKARKGIIVVAVLAGAAVFIAGGVAVFGPKTASQPLLTDSPTTGVRVLKTPSADAPTAVVAPAELPDQGQTAAATPSAAEASPESSDQGQTAAATPSGQSINPLPQSSNPVAANFKQYRQLLPRDAIRPIYEPQFIPGEESSLRWEELVIGVELNGDSRAYPIGPLNFREMVNDVVGGVPILVTW